eukprot:gene15228-6243_t
MYDEGDGEGAVQYRAVSSIDSDGVTELECEVACPWGVPGLTASATAALSSQHGPEKDRFAVGWEQSGDWYTSSGGAG